MLCLPVKASAISPSPSLFPSLLFLHCTASSSSRQAASTTATAAAQRPTIAGMAREGGEGVREGVREEGGGKGQVGREERGGGAAEVLVLFLPLLLLVVLPCIVAFKLLLLLLGGEGTVDRRHNPSFPGRSLRIWGIHSRHVS